MVTRKHLFPAALLGAFALAGCSTFQQIEGSAISPQTAAIAVNTAAALEAAGLIYMSEPACGPSAPVICLNQSVGAKVAPAIRTIHVAARQVVAALHSSNGAAIPIASYNTLTSTITILQSIYSQNNINVPAVAPVVATN